MEQIKNKIAVIKCFVKIVLILLICFALLVSCSNNQQGSLEETFGEALQNIETEDTTNQSSLGFENPNNIDYSAYTAVVKSYRKALSSAYGELTDQYSGYFYANLVDFNADDVYELVVARVYNSDTEGNVEEMFNPKSEYFIGSESKLSVHIYYLNEDGVAVHADSFPFSYYGDEDMQFNIEYTEVDGRNYFVLGGHNVDLGITSADYVYSKIINCFNGEYFDVEETFVIEYDYQNAEYEATEYRQNMNVVSENEFNTQFYEKWQANSTEYIVVSQGYETNTEEVTKATIDFLSGFEIKNIHGGALTYTDGNFVLFEGNYFSEEEAVLKQFLEAVTRHDFLSIKPFTDNEVIIENYQQSRESEQYYPGLIVEKIEMLNPINYASHDVQVMQTILEGEQYRQNALENTFILKVEAKEIIDMETVQYAGQFGLNVTQYYMFETDEDGQNIKLLENFDDNFFWGDSNVYEVSYITDYEQVFNAYGYEYPFEIMSMYFTSEELERMDHYITEDAKEVYFIRNLWGGSMKIYENYIDENNNYARGELLHETFGDVLYLACRSDKTLGNLNYSDLQIVAEPFAGFEAVYYPAISYPETAVLVGEYAQEMVGLN